MENLQTDRVQHRLDWRRWMVAIAGLVLGLQLWVTPTLALSVTDIPNITADSSTWVVDAGDVLSPLSEQTINQSLGQLAAKTGHEVRFVTVRGLDYGETPESFTDNLFAQWFPQVEDQANQTLLVLETKTNSPAIRTGDEVKAMLPEDVAQSIATENLLIPVREEHYNQGFLDARARIVAILSGESDPGPPEVKTTEVNASNYVTAEEANNFNSSVIVVVLLIVATVVPMVTYYYYQNQ